MSATSGFTGANTARTGGVLFIGDALNLGASQLASAEAIVIKSGGAIRANDSIAGNEVILRDCSIFIDGLDSPFSTITAVLSYASASEKRSVSSAADLTLDRCLVIQRESAGGGVRRHYFIANLYNTTLVCEGNKTAFLVTDFNAKIKDVYLKSLAGYQPAGAFSYAVGLTLDATDFLFSNNGRLETEGLTLLNQSTRPIQMVGGGGVFNSLYLWNRSATVDSTKYFITNATLPATGGIYTSGYKGEHIFEGYTASWLFVDQADSAPVEGVKVCYYDNIANLYEYTAPLAKKAEYLTNAEGKLVGTWDTRLRTTGASQVRETMWLLTNRTNTNGSDYQVVGSPQSYSLHPTAKQIAVKSYLHAVNPAFQQGTAFEITGKIGEVNELFTASTYQPYFLSLDESITEANQATVDAYTTLDTPEKLYDRAKSAWYDNETYPLLTRSGNTVDLGSYNLTIDAAAAAAYAFNGSTITIKASQYVGNLTTSGTITLANGAQVLGSYGSTTVLPWSVTNVEAGSTLQLFNVTQGLEVENLVVGGTAGAKVAASGAYTNAEAEPGDTIRLRITCQAGAMAMEPYETFAVASSVGTSFRADQRPDAVYNANGIDGSAVTTLTADYPNVQIDISDGDGVADARELYAFYVFQSTTQTGIEEWFGAITPIDLVNYRVNTAVVDLHLQNVGPIPLVISGARIYRDDNTSILEAEPGDQPMTMDAGNLIQYIAPQIDGAINANAKIAKVAANTELIPALL
jgi:hypothetical protein